MENQPVTTIPKTEKTHQNRKIILVCFSALVVFLYVGYGIYGFCFLQESYDETVSSKIEKLSDSQNLVYYSLVPHDVEFSSELSARSVMIVDVTTGSILYEKNADEVISPASLTKIVSLYTFFDDVKAEKKSLTDEIILRYEDSYNALPARASNMQLQSGQKISVENLVLGMAVPSANDAAIAIANYDIGYYSENTISDFARKMNEKIKSLSKKENALEKSFFVEPSGLSEKNLTTAREFSIIARNYILDFPENLEKYHCKQFFEVEVENSDDESSSKKTKRFNATNQVLKRMPECDGLKTGYIDESGFNQATTGKKDNTRILVVTLGGQGKDYMTGLKNRADDAENCLKWAFNNFTTANIPQLEPIAKPLRNAPLSFGNTVWLVETQNNDITLSNKISNITRNINLPKYIEAPVKKGETLGFAEYYAGELLLAKIPLAATYDIPMGSGIKSFLDYITNFFVAMNE